MVRVFLALCLALATPVLASPALPAPPPPPAGVVSGGFVLPDRPPWAGEVFTLRFVWQVDWERFRYLDGDLAWVADPLVTEGWISEPPGAPLPQGGRSLAALGFTTRAIALAPGSIVLQAASQPMQIVTGSYETSGVTIATIQAVLARSAGTTPTIRPLPSAPPNFSGAVGDFALTSSLGAAAAAVGRPIVWTLTLAGTGNWMAFEGIPSRPLPRAFEMAGTPQRSVAATSSLFDRQIAEAITIVPQQAGSYTLGPVTMIVFDPAAGRFRTIAAPAVRLEIRPAAGRATAGNRPAAPPAVSDTGLPPALSGVGRARAPLPRWAWVSVLALPFVAISLLWFGLATQRALTTDPARAARRADARLRRTVAALAAAPDAAFRRALLRDWQRDAGIRLRIDHAAPTPDRVGAADWAQLWAEADGHLYGAGVALPPDWPDRARCALTETPAPARFDTRQIFTAANLYPVAGALCLVLVSLPGPLAATAAPPTSPAIAPLDWIGHYNRGRQAALADDWPLAAAHAGIAWVQAPRSAETTALWRLAAREAGVVGGAGGGLPVPVDSRARLTGLLSPFGWQAVTLAAALLTIGGFGSVLLWRFGHVSRRARLPGAVAAAVGTLGFAIGCAGVTGYGPAAAPDAAITWRQVPLRSLPVDTPAAGAVLAPGTLGHHDAAFLGWSRLTLGDGRAVWVRRGEVIPIWKAQK